MTTKLAQGIERFTVTQKLTLMVNRYEIRTATDGGQPGDLLAFAEQKRAAFKEQVTFYEDQAKTTPAFSFKARQRLDIGATYDIQDAAGQPLGTFTKAFGKSLLRSTWHLESGGLKITGTERSLPVAIGRRIWESTPLGDIFSPFRFHFDFVTSTGGVVMTSERGRSVRDRYLITLPGGRIDGRVAAAMAVALDALQAR